MQVTIDDLRALVGCPQTNSLGFKVGQKVCIRTVTYHYCGVVERVAEGVVTLSTATWIADSGRWSEFLGTGIPSECELYPGSVHVALGSVVDWSELDAIPNSTK